MVNAVFMAGAQLKTQKLEYLHYSVPGSTPTTSGAEPVAFYHMSTIMVNVHGSLNTEIRSNNTMQLATWGQPAEGGRNWPAILSSPVQIPAYLISTQTIEHTHY